MRKVLRKVFGPVRVGDDFRIRYNSELYELLNDLDVVQRINIQRRRWLGHADRVEEDAPARRVVDAGFCGSRLRGINTSTLAIIFLSFCNLNINRILNSSTTVAVMDMSLPTFWVKIGRST